MLFGNDKLSIGAAVEEAIGAAVEEAMLLALFDGDS